MIFLITESDQPEKSSVKHTPHELGVKEGKEVDFKLLTKPNKMKEKTLAIIVLLFMVGMITLVGTAFAAWLFRGAF